MTEEGEVAAPSHRAAVDGEHTSTTAEVEVGEIIAAFDEDDDTPVQRGELARVMRVMARSHTGPLPATEEMTVYDQLIDDGANRIMAMAEREQSHRHDMQSRQQTTVESVARYDYNVSRIGQILALVVSLAILATGIVFLLNGAPVVGGTIITADIVALASVFVLGKKREGEKIVSSEKLANDALPSAARDEG